MVPSQAPVNAFSIARVLREWRMATSRNQAEAVVFVQSRLGYPGLSLRTWRRWERGAFTRYSFLREEVLRVISESLVEKESA